MPCHAFCDIWIFLTPKVGVVGGGGGGRHNFVHFVSPPIRVGRQIVLPSVSDCLSLCHKIMSAL